MVRMSVYIAVLVFCMSVSIYFSKIFIQNQISGSTHTAKTDLIENADKLNLYTNHINSMISSYEIVDIGNVYQITNEIKQSRSILDDSVVSRVGVDTQQGTLDDLIDNLEKIQFDNAGSEEYRQALAVIDVTEVQRVIHAIRQYEADAGDSDTQEALEIEKWEKESEAIGLIFDNLSAIDIWKRSGEKHTEYYDAKITTSDIGREMKYPANMKKSEKDAYESKEEEIRDKIAMVLALLPDIHLIDKDTGYKSYDNSMIFLDERKQDLVSLQNDIHDAINQVEVSPADSPGFFDPGDTEAERQSFRMSMMLSIGIDFAILLLCLVVRKMEPSSKAQDQAELMQDAAAPKTKKRKPDSHALTISALYMAGILFIIIINLFDYDLSWQNNFMMGFILLFVLLVISIILTWCSSAKEKKEDKQSDKVNPQELSSYLIYELEEKISIELRVLIDGIELNIGQYDKKWVAYKHYQSRDIQDNENLKKIIAFLIARELVEMDANYLKLSQTFFDMLLRITMDKYDDAEWMNDQLKKYGDHSDKSDSNENQNGGQGKPGEDLAQNNENGE